MRPIDKGTTPTTESGIIKVVTDHKNWRKDLIDRLGAYCCYCNMPLTDSPQVEHVVAQNLGGNILDWNNLLLACGACNRIKSDEPFQSNTHYLPEIHNTYLAFDFRIESVNGEMKAFVIPTNTLMPNQRAKAVATIRLCALDRDTTRIEDQITDMRWKFRFESCWEAIFCRKDWDDWGKNVPSNFLPLLITIVVKSGFWWVWFMIFYDVEVVRQALVTQFVGTARDCFDAQYNPIPRNTNDI
jgi:hypothetical protein